MSNLFDNILKVEFVKQRQSDSSGNWGEWIENIEVTFVDPIFSPRGGNGANGLNKLVLNILKNQPQFKINPSTSGSGFYIDDDGIDWEYSIQVYVNHDHMEGDNDERA